MIHRTTKTVSAKERIFSIKAITLGNISKITLKIHLKLAFVFFKFLWFRNTYLVRRVFNRNIFIYIQGVSCKNISSNYMAQSACNLRLIKSENFLSP